MGYGHFATGYSATSTKAGVDRSMLDLAVGLSRRGGGAGV